MRVLPNLRSSRMTATQTGNTTKRAPNRRPTYLIGGLALFGAGLSLGLLSRSELSPKEGIVPPVKYADRNGMLAVRLKDALFLSSHPLT